MSKRTSQGLIASLSLDFPWISLDFRYNPLADLKGLLRVPQVTIRTTLNGREETLTEYLCDWPDCPEVAVHAVGIIRELRAITVMCAEHAAHITHQAE